MKIHFLGTFEIKDGEEIIHFSRRMDQSLFAYLVINGGIPHRREKLAALFWPDYADEAGRENLRHVLWRIRKTLPPRRFGPLLLADDLSITFKADPEIWFDVARVKSAKAFTEPVELMSALGSYGGELLPGFTEEWVTLEREYIDSIFEHQMARLMALLQTARRWLDILECGERWLALGQRPEPAYRALMLAHREMGEMSKVADIYSRCVRSLREIGLDPSLQTRELFETLVSGTHIGDAAVTPRSR